MVVLAEIPASRGELALVGGALLARAPAPGGVNFQERVLDVVALFSHVSSVADRMAPVRLALVSPYSYTYPGGVGRHVEALAEELTGLGHEVRLLAPYDPDDRLARVLHRGAAPQPRPLPDYVIPLGRTFGLPMNGAVSHLSGFPEAIGVLGRELRSGHYDVVHVHEPNAPVVSWYAAEAARAPVVGTFHTYSTSAFVNQVAANVAGARRLYSKLSARIAVSEAARWTAQRFYGGAVPSLGPQGGVCAP